MGTRFIMINGFWIAVIFLLGSEANEVCYERLGCFSDEPPWCGIPGRQLLGLPQSPESMNITFNLFTKESGNTSQKITATNKSTIETSYFSLSRKTAFIIHGYTSTGRHGWVVEMCLLLVRVGNINCIAVDWEDGAKCTYFMAASNIRVLGAEIAYLINTLTEIYKYCPSKIHLIGHSLGAHTAGEAGRRLRGVDKKFPAVGRITGLDPAALCFEAMPAMVRLDQTDAIFVDVIHSNAGPSLTTGLGMFNATGHVDFYPNGGTTMPGCNELITARAEDEPETFPQVTRGIGICHHARSHVYFRYSILCPDGFIGYPCESYDSFKEGKCFPCPKEGCPMMGYYADRFYDKLKDDNPKFFLNTGPMEPFYSWRYKISLKLSGAARGDINIIFHGKEGNTKEYPIASGRLQHGRIYSKFIDTEINLANVTRVEFLWYKWFFTLFWTKLGAERVTLIRGQDGHESHFCGYEKVQYKVPQTLTPC
ncbi:pancreatic lipase-related protein 2-like [Heteronotia binoei]|uniref:pancreatic lipase-related protein 2-like n=1 Tax=Heteronotia binoei TaxID=13085 RepID=UPI00292FDB08|nr:pancreatic lipase-related protein 2-like [Heteronotia binoei]